jgi:PAS domain S-box-containing protein
MPDALRSRVAAVARLDSNWRISAASPAFYALLGRHAADVIGHSFLEFTEAQADWFAGMSAADLLDDERAITQDFQVRAPSGEVFWVRAGMHLSAAEDGTLFPDEISLVEIEDLRQDGGEQARQAALLDRALTVVDEAVWVRRMPGGEILYASPAYERIWGGRRDQLEGDAGNWMKQIHPDDRGRVETEVRRQQSARQPFDVEYRIIRGDGATRWIWDRGTPAQNLFGSVDVYVGSAQDITERKAHEFELARRQAADNIDTTAAALAHNFNNLLAIVDLAARAIEREDQFARHADRLGSIHSAVERGGEITELLLTISSRHDLNSSYVDLNVLVTEMKPLVTGSLGPNHRLIYDVSSAPCPVQIDRTGLNQALLNLVKNSREAMPDGGELLIQTRVLPSPALSGGEDTGTPCVQISVEDSGTGMSEHALNHAADPYFTTKPHGSGLGLAATDSFVRRSGGSLTLANRTGGGLIVQMTFPLALPPGDIANSA